MTNAEKKRFIQLFINRVKGNLLEKVYKIPENWGSHELKFWIAECFKNEVSELMGNEKMRRDRKRIKECKNDIIVNNL